MESRNCRQGGMLYTIDERLVRAIAQVQMESSPMKRFVVVGCEGRKGDDR